MQNLADTRNRLEALISAFAGADYIVDAEPKPIKLQLGRLAPRLNRLLGGRDWAIVTAHNPDGRLQSDQCNAAADERLKKYLNELAPAACLPARNRDPSGQWPDEPGWLFTPEDFTQADRLARRFGQRAIVAGGVGEPAALRIYAANCTALPDFARIVRS